MLVVMTLMVRDEADIVGAMLAHHRAFGVDHMIVTDNGSVDGTTEILREFAETGFVTLWHDPVHRKQQYQVVTQMARYAATELGADWVINADADEFWLTTDRSRALHDVLGGVSASVHNLTVPVINLTGTPARDGSGLSRLVYRDQRTESELHAAGIPFHPTPNAVHRGNSEIEISQGNHFVSAPGWGEGWSEGVQSTELEVLHLPWRSWRQYEQKVRHAGAAYLANPELQPSPRHHGMQDYRRLLGGCLEPIYIAKHPTEIDLGNLVKSGSLVKDEILTTLRAEAVPGIRAEVAYETGTLVDLGVRGRQFSAMEAEFEDRLQSLCAEQAHERSIWVAEHARAEAEIARLAGEIDRIRRRRILRAADRLARMLHPKPR